MAEAGQSTLLISLLSRVHPLPPDSDLPQYGKRTSPDGSPLASLPERTRTETGSPARATVCIS